MTLGAGQPKKAADPRVQGAYALEYRGYLEGTGIAAVSAKAVTVNAHVKDPAGSAGNFVAPNLPIVDGRFQGKATVLGLDVSLSGRLDPPDETVRTARLVCTYTLSNGMHGRFIGLRK